MRTFYQTILVVVITLLGTISNAINGASLAPNLSKPLIDHLKEVNVQWEWASQMANTELLKCPAAFNNDNMRIQAHLSMVENLLRTHTPKGLNAVQMNNRKICLDILHSYMVEGKFPANLYVNHRQPFFIDEHGTACAVGYLMIQTGYESIAQQIQNEFNTGYVAELAPCYPQILTWAEKYGFLPRELALIQPGYTPSFGYDWELLGDGTDGAVRASTQLPNGDMVIGGDFVHASWVTCNGVAVWNGQDFLPLGNGLSGQVYALAYFGGNLWAGGFFNIADNTYNLARWNGTNWVYQNIGLGTTHALLVYNSRLFVANEGGVFVRYNTTWSSIGYFNGPIYTLSSFNGNLVAGGSFSQANGGSAANIAQYTSAQVWTPLGTGIQTPVRALAVMNNTLYAGSDFSVNTPSGLLRWNNNTWQPLINTNNYAPNGQGGRINTLAVYNNELYIGGYFQSGLSNCLGRYKPSDNSFSVLTSIDGSIITEVLNLGIYANNLYIGGTLGEMWGDSGDITFVNNIMRTDLAYIGMQLQCWLQGPYNTTTQNMVSNLRSNNLLPLQQPYNTAPWFYDGQESVATSSNIPADAIDWVLVELRDTSNAHHLVDTRAGWLLSNGIIVDITGGNKIKFANAQRLGQYYIIIRHRNHLATMSSYALTAPNASPFSFAYADNVAGGSSQLTALGNSIYGFCAGDLDANGVITVNDSNILNGQLSTINQYVVSDCNLNKSVTTSDFNLFKPNMSRIGVETIRY